MIEMQYNFPLLHGQGEQWSERLRLAIDQLHPDDADELRPTFRMKRLAQRELAAQWLQSEPAGTWIVYGGHHGTLIAIMAAELAGKTIAVDAITYGGILEQARMLGCKLIPLTYDDEGMTPDSLRSACQHEPIAAIYTMPSVHNPLGCTASLARRQAIAQLAEEWDLLIIEDDAYGYMLAEPLPTYAQLAPARTFYVRGLSKSYAPATTTGFLVAPLRFTPGIETAIKNSTTGTSLVANIAALSLIADGSIDRIMAAKRAEGARRNTAARAALGTAAAPGAPSAWHLWVHLPEGLTPQQAEAACEAQGALISGGHWFTAPGITARGLRIGLGGELDPNRTQQGVEIVAKVLDLSNR